MAFGFRKSLKLGPLRVNFSKSAVGVSTKIGPISQSINSKGMGRTSASLPGTGVFYRKQRNFKKKTQAQ